MSRRTPDVARIRELEPLTGAARFMDRIVYQKPTQRDAHVLYFAGTWLTDNLNTQGRLLVRSEEHNAGKTTVLDAAVMMSKNPWMSDPTKWALQGKFRSPDGRPTIIIDETSIIFGLNGQRGRSNPIYKPIVEGYRRTATFSGQVDGAPQDFSAYCACVLAGLKAAVPPDLRSRCIVTTMYPAPDGYELEDSLDEGVESDGQRIGEQFRSWTALFAEESKDWAKLARKLHPKLTGRKLQVWGGMYVVAKAAGPEWERRFLAAFVDLALSEAEKPILSPEQQILKDAGDYLRSPLGTSTGLGRYLFSRDLLDYVRGLEDKVYTTKTDAQIARLMSEGLGRAGVLTLPDRRTQRGWHRDLVLSLVAELEALLNPVEDDEEEDEFEDFFDVDEDIPRPEEPEEEAA